MTGNLTLASFYGIDAWMEHPDIIEGQHGHLSKGAPSIWFLEAVKRLELLPFVRHHSAPHYKYGGQSVKPTRLFTVRMATLSQRLSQWRHVRHPSQSLRGKNEDGSWRTSRAKEYPRRLSAAIAYAMVDALRRTPVRNMPCQESVARRCHKCTCRS